MFYHRIDLPGLSFFITFALFNSKRYAFCENPQALDFVNIIR